MAGRRTRLATALLAAQVGMVGLVGCGGPGSGRTGSGRTGSGRTIELAARFSKFSPPHLEVAAGTTVKLVVHNVDPIAHELIIGDAGVHERHENGTEAWHAPRPGEVSIPAGETRATTYTFGTTPGQVVEFGCHLPGHWAYGMRGTASVS